MAPKSEAMTIVKFYSILLIYNNGLCIGFVYVSLLFSVECIFQTFSVETIFFYHPVL